jgi:hypothetical protein
MILLIILLACLYGTVDSMDGYMDKEVHNIEDLNVISSSSERQYIGDEDRDAVIIMDVHGGVGNQLFMVAQALSFSKKHSINYILFDRTIFTYRPTYWVTIFNSVADHVIEARDLTVVKGKNEYDEKSVIIKEEGKSEFSLRAYYEEKPPLASKAIPASYATADVFVHGYFQSFDTFHDEWPWIREKLDLMSLKEKVKNKIQSFNFQDFDFDFDHTIGLHFRLADYYESESHYVLPILYYVKAIEYILSTTGRSDWTVLCFYENNDLDVLESNLITLHRIAYLQNQFPYLRFISRQSIISLEDWEDMLLMSLCAAQIIANSSFSWWAAFLNGRDTKEDLVVYPSIISKFSKNLIPNSTERSWYSVDTTHLFDVKIFISGNNSDNSVDKGVIAQLTYPVFAESIRDDFNLTTKRHCASLTLDEYNCAQICDMVFEKALHALNKKGYKSALTGTLQSDDLTRITLTLPKCNLFSTSGACAYQELKKNGWNSTIPASFSSYHSNIEKSISTSISTVTVVTCFYLIPSKQGKNKEESRIVYSLWIKNFMKINTKCVIYVDEESKAYLESLWPSNTNRQYILRPLEDFVVANIGIDWMIHYNMDPEHNIHNPMLYKIWNEKVFMVADVVMNNPYNTETFMWTDIGSYRNETILHLLNKQIRTFPSSQTFNHSKVTFPFIADYTLEEKNNIDIIDTRFLFNNRIAGGHFAGGAEAILQFSELHKNILLEADRRGVFAGKDQSLYCFNILRHPNLFSVRKTNKFDCPLFTDEWFAIQCSWSPGAPIIKPKTLFFSDMVDKINELRG